MKTQKFTKEKIFLYSVLALLIPCLFFIQKSFGKDGEETFAYKLALFHTRDSNPEEALINSSLMPERATVTEFQWLMDSLKNRCRNSEQAIADTLLQVWQYLKKRGLRHSLLDISRSLNKFSQDRTLFGAGKVDFRTVANRWILQNKGMK